MSEMSVRFDALQSGAAGIDSTYARLTSTLQGLEADLQPMVASWSGAAQEAYLTCKKQWEDAANQLATLLNGIGKAVGQAHENYTSTENAVHNLWA